MSAKKVIIAACQTGEIEGDIDFSLNTILHYSNKAQTQNAKLLCFPECFLQGYVVGERTQRLAIDLSSSSFKKILNQLKDITPILIIGLIETDGQSLFNSVIVVREGKLIGCYRKVHLFGQENQIFESGSDFPIFEVDGLKFGINICNDLNFSECAKSVSKQNAHLLVCPCNNMMSLQKAEEWKHKHNEIRSALCLGTGLWLASSDVTGERNGKISYGPTAVISPEGNVVSQIPLLKEGLLIHSIPVQ